jgi:hypothetical protein
VSNKATRSAALPVPLWVAPANAYNVIVLVVNLPGIDGSRPAAGHATTAIARNFPYLDRDQKHHLRFDAMHGWEIVDNTALCVMNLLLHGLGAEDAESPIRVDDALGGKPPRRGGVF